MTPSRKIAAEFFVVFLIGALAGGFVTWSFTDRELSTFMLKTNDPDSVIIARTDKKYVNEYHLTPDEMARIQPLIVEMAKHISKTRRQFGLDILDTLDDYHRKIALQLTPEHRAAYEKAHEIRAKALRNLLLPDSGTTDQGQL